MKKVSEWLREKKKIILVLLLVALLILIVFLFFGTDGGSFASGDGYKSQAEVRLTQLLESIDGVGEAEVMITEDDSGITGVVVVCDGADRLMVRNDILNAVSTALNINKKIIAIYSM